MLEVIDEYENSTCWDDSFATQKAAVDEAVQAIEEEGIDVFIGSADGTFIEEIAFDK